MTPETALAAALAIPALGAAAVAACHRAPNLRETATLAAAVLTFAAVATLVGPVLDGERPAIRFVELMPGIALELVLEPLGLLFALIASGLWIVSAVYSIGYMRGNDEAHQTRFYVCFALAIAAAIGVAAAGNLLTLFLFYEALTLVTYPLVTHHGDDEARRGGRTYLARAARLLDRASAAGARRDLGVRRNARVRARRHPRGQGDGRRRRRPRSRCTRSASARRR